MDPLTFLLPLTIRLEHLFQHAFHSLLWTVNILIWFKMSECASVPSLAKAVFAPLVPLALLPWVCIFSRDFAHGGRRKLQYLCAQKTQIFCVHRDKLMNLAIAGATNCSSFLSRGVRGVCKVNSFWNSFIVHNVQTLLVIYFNYSLKTTRGSM